MRLPLRALRARQNPGGHAAVLNDGDDKIADGDLSEEHLDVIAETDAETGAATTTNAGFINDYLEHADIIGVLYDKNGQPLWIGRARRHASLMQRYALIARDKACVRCRTDHQQCAAHHLMPSNAPAKGETNLDELALLCAPSVNLESSNKIWRTASIAIEQPSSPLELVSSLILTATDLPTFGEVWVCLAVGLVCGRDCRTPLSPSNYGNAVRSRHRARPPFCRRRGCLC